MVFTTVVTPSNASLFFLHSNTLIESENTSFNSMARSLLLLINLISEVFSLTKTDNIDTYSSDISERISKDELKTKIQNLGLD